jgi:hypothetical protein
VAYNFKKTVDLVSRELTLQHEMAMTGMLNGLSIPLILGPVGAGKTAIASMASVEWELPLMSINSGENSDPTDVTGIPFPTNDSEGRYTEWILNKIARAAILSPIMLLIDDVDKAPQPLMNALLAIAATRQFRGTPIHRGTLIIMAGNRVDDDISANPISESLLTRVTTIEMVPDLESFSTYGTTPTSYRPELARDKGAQAIHPTVLGYLHYKPEHLHKWGDGVNRFPTPRGWWEVSRHMYRYDDGPDHLGWANIVSRKCGDHVGTDFKAWAAVISKIDLPELLEKGNPVWNNVTGKERRMFQYAAIFAMSSALAKSVKASYKGLPKIVGLLADEMKVALLVQLSSKTRSAIDKKFAGTMAVLMEPIVKSSVPQVPGAAA